MLNREMTPTIHEEQLLTATNKNNWMKTEATII